MASARSTFTLALPIIILGTLLSRAPFMMLTTAPSKASQWADGPMKMIQNPQIQSKQNDMFTVGATHMGLLHNTIFRGYNSIYHQANNVKEADKADFIGYCQTWHKFVKSHHDDEEAVLFTTIEELLDDKTVWSETHKEHESFLPGLEQFDKYLASLASPSAFSAAKLLEIMASFEAPFHEHFHHEIEVITSMKSHPKAPRPGSPEEAAAALALKKWGKSTVTKAGMTDVVPFFLLNLDRTAEEGEWANWPPIPPPIKWGLINIAGAWHSGWWKFTSCDAAGRPRQLYAV